MSVSKVVCGIPNFPNDQCYQFFTGILPTLLVVSIVLISGGEINLSALNISAQKYLF